MRQLLPLVHRERTENVVFREQLDHRFVSVPFRRVECVAAPAVGDSPAVEEQPDHRLVAFQCRRLERVAVLAALGVDVGPDTIDGYCRPSRKGRVAEDKSQPETRATERLSDSEEPGGEGMAGQKGAYRHSTSFVRWAQPGNAGCRSHNNGAM
ncbi:hypothetical protein EX30DRAFT_378713 [Ascodesmis nigricans]|uniref:Uncharacterized protein n=1 Tax=Ascodesmis nigricans TaxID=341454 RepID=A0A4S2MVX2_9PEZI|nr:hypothetical protein EX30DRAFT_378713 [Ascodesmis nigricans]